MGETWYYLTAEITALKWRAFAYGPEAWLVIPWILGIIGLVFGLILPGRKKNNRSKRRYTRRGREK